MIEAGKKIIIPELRRVDDLGRIVIPKKLRNHFDIDFEGLVEIFPCEEGILIKKSKMKDLRHLKEANK